MSKTIMGLTLATFAFLGACGDREDDVTVYRNGSWRLSEMVDGNQASTAGGTALDPNESLYLTIQGENEGRIEGNSSLRFPGHDYFFSNDPQFVWTFKANGDRDRDLVVIDEHMRERHYKITEISQSIMVLRYDTGDNTPAVQFVFRRAENQAAGANGGNTTNGAPCVNNGPTQAPVRQDGGNNGGGNNVGNANGNGGGNGVATNGNAGGKRPYVNSAN